MDFLPLHAPGLIPLPADREASDGMCSLYSVIANSLAINLQVHRSEAQQGCID